MREASKIEPMVARRFAAILRIETRSWPTSSVERVSPISIAKFWSAKLLADSTASLMGAVILRTMTETNPAAASTAASTRKTVFRRCSSRAVTLSCRSARRRLRMASKVENNESSALEASGANESADAKSAMVRLPSPSPATSCRATATTLRPASRDSRRGPSTPEGA